MLLSAPPTNMIEKATEFPHCCVFCDARALQPFSTILDLNAVY